MLYQPSQRTVIQIDTKFRIDHLRSPFLHGSILYEDHSVFISFAGDNAKPYDILFNKRIFSDERGYWGWFTDYEVKRMKVEEAHI